LHRASMSCPTRPSSDRSSVDRKSSQDKPLSEKTSADFAHYFQTTYTPTQPDIRKARKRGRDKIEVHYDFITTTLSGLTNVRLGRDRKSTRLDSTHVSTS